MKQALILVDVQESFRRRPYFRDEELPRFLRNVQSLINRCQSRGIALVQVFHDAENRVRHAVHLRQKALGDDGDSHDPNVTSRPAGQDKTT